MSDTSFTTIGDEPVEARIVSWVLGEASAFEAAELERLCDERPELMIFKRRMAALHALLAEAEKTQADESWKLPPEKRRAVEELFGEAEVVRLDIEKERRVRHSGRLALLAVAACLVITFVIVRLQPWKHTSEAIIEVKPRVAGMSPLGGDMTESSGKGRMTSQFLGTEFEKIKSRRNLEKVAENLDLAERWNMGKEQVVEKLKESINTENVRGTDLLKIQVRQSDKKEADQIAREVAYAYKDYREELDKQVADRQLAELNKAVRDQEDKVEERRKVLATITRTKGQLGANDSREDAIKRGLDAQDYADAKRDFETDQQLLQTMKLKQMAETISRKSSSESVVVHDVPEEDKTDSGDFALASNSPSSRRQPLRTELPRELIEGTPKPMNVPNLETTVDGPAGSSTWSMAERSGRGRGKTDIPAKPATAAVPSSSTAKEVAANTRALQSAPVPDVEVAAPSLDFGDVQDFGGGFSGGQSSEDGAGRIAMGNRSGGGVNASQEIDAFSSRNGIAPDEMRSDAYAWPEKAGQADGFESSPVLGGLLSKNENSDLYAESNAASGTELSGTNEYFGAMAVSGGFAAGGGSAGYGMNAPAASPADASDDSIRLGRVAGVDADVERSGLLADLDTAWELTVPGNQKAKKARYDSGWYRDGEMPFEGVESGLSDSKRSGLQSQAEGGQIASLDSAAPDPFEESPASGNLFRDRLGIDEAEKKSAVHAHEHEGAKAFRFREMDLAKLNEQDPGDKDALAKAVRDQEDKVEEKRKVLATIVRNKGIIYKGQDSFYSQGGVDEDQGAKDETREEAIKRGLDAQDYVDAKKDFEKDQKLLEQMRLKLTEASIRAKRQTSKPDLSKIMEEIPAAQEPYSTFSLNISDASFKIAQAALAKGEQPDPAGIKVEQFYNAVDYGDPSPSASEPVAVSIEQAAHPVIPGRNLVRIALKTAAAGRSASQPLRLTLLVDQSGSMVREDRRAAMNKALSGLSELLTKNDLVTVVGFSRQTRLLADGLSGDKAGKLSDIVNQAASEGGTNLEEAINLADRISTQRKLDGAQNRIVLFTDGAANLGNADPERLAEKVKQLRQKGIAFDIAGIAADDLNDELLGELARHGNGRYYVVGKGGDDNFAKQLAGAFHPAAENVKVQVRFNPERVGRYKLIGFEKDRLKTEDFRNDRVDAAELAAEEAGVAIYQVETLPEGNGEIGEVSVRFRDTAGGEMVERSWTIPQDSGAPAIDRATPSMQLATLAMLAGEKLKGGPLADAIDFRQLSEPAANVRQYYGSTGRVGEMLRVVDALK